MKINRAYSCLLFLFIITLFLFNTNAYAGYNITLITYGSDFVAPDTGTLLPQGNVLQFINVGGNGTIDPPSAGGGVTGDDTIISTYAVGENVFENGYSYIVEDTTNSGFNAYFRVFDTDNLNTAIKYGDSTIIAIAANAPPAAPADYPPVDDPPIAFGTTTAVPDETGPTTSNVLTNGSSSLWIQEGTASIDLTASITDVGSGSSNISAAEYFIGTSAGTNGTGIAMAASDGAFDTTTENVNATVVISDWTTGVYTLWVNGKDAQDNWGTAQSVQFTVYTPVAVPTLSPGTGTYNIGQDVTITPAQGAIHTYYTTDGSEPDNTDTEYTVPLAIDANDAQVVTVKAVSYDGGNNKGVVGSAVYTFDKTGPIAPTLAPGAGTYNTAQAVTPTLAGDAVSTYYTLDGTDPDNSKTAYTSGTISVDGNNGDFKELKIVSYDAVGNKGATGMAEYVFDKIGPDAPTFDIGTGTYNMEKHVTPTVAGDATSTYYTLDGTDPSSTNGTQYTDGSIIVDGDHGVVKTLKAVSYDAVGNKGTTGSAVYTFDKQGPAAPTLNPGTGFYKEQQNVTPTLAGDASTTYYTLDGTDPSSSNGTQYTTGTIAINANDGVAVTLKIVSYDVLENIGTIGSGIYTFDKAQPTAAITNPAQSVHVTSAAYTISGTEDDGSGSGVASVEVSINNGDTYNAATIGNSWSYNATLAKGANAIKVKVTDNVGNFSIIDGPTLTYYDALVIKVDGTAKTEIFVSNVSGNNTKTIVVENGSENFANYVWTLNDNPHGALSAGGSASEKVFTANIGEEGIDTLTITDPENSALYVKTLTINVISLSLTGNEHIASGTPSDYTVAGSIGTINWSITTGSNVAGTPVPSGTRNTIATVTPLTTGNFTIRATDSQTSAFATKDVTVLNPVTLTSASSGITDESTLQINATGGTGSANGDYTWTITSGNGTVVDGLFTPAAGTGVRTAVIKATDKTYTNISGQKTITVVDPIVIAGKPAHDAMQSGTENTFSFTGGSGTVTWTASSGSITSNGVFTAPEVTENSQVVHITATDSTYSNITATYDLTVYATLGITNKPETTPTVESGQSSQKFIAAGGDSDFIWTVEGPSQAAGGEGSEFTFVAPTAGDFAGTYTVHVSDGNEFMDSFQIIVPFAISPNKGTFTEKNLDDGTVNEIEFAANGVTPTSCTWLILNSATATEQVTNRAEYGTFAQTTEGAVNVFASADIQATKKFWIKVTVEGDEDLTTENGLKTRIAGPFILLPVANFTVTVKDSAGALAGAEVEVDADYAGLPNPVDTLTDGKAVFILPDVGATYLYMVTKTGFVNKNVSSTSKDVTVTLQASASTISGNVKNTGEVALSSARIFIYQPNAITTKYEAKTGVNGNYTVNLPTGAPSTGWTVVTQIDGYVPDKQTGIASNSANVNFTLQQKTTITNVVSTQGNSVQLDFTASPAFTATTQATVEIVTGNGAFSDTLTLTDNLETGATLTITYDTNEDFTVKIAADTSEDNNPSTGYATNILYQHKAVAKGVSTSEVNSSGGSGELQKNSQTTRVGIPAGGISVDNTTIFIMQVEKTASEDKLTGSRIYVYEVSALDSDAGTDLADSAIDRIEITLPIDLEVVSPGDLENGKFSIYHAATQDDLENGKGTAVPVANIISTDYLGEDNIGSVTFWVGDLSFFGIGLGVPVAASGHNDDNCFIATAAYGSLLEPHVQVLRQFRDVYLLSNTPGSAFVETYYKYSPPLADFIAKHDGLRAVVRVLLMPVIGIGYVALHTGMAEKALILFMILALAVGIFRMRRRMVSSVVE